jgi:hypothetical protein
VQPTQPPPPPTQAQPTQAPPPPPTQALPPAQTVTASPAGTATASESGGLGLFGWIVLIALVAAAIAGPLIWRSRRRSAWDTELDALVADTRTVTATRLPPVLTTETVAQRGLAWAPLRTDLISLLDRWNALAARAPGDDRQLRSGQLQRLLRELVDAVDAENEALATGRDWTLLRPRVNEAERALAAALTPPPPPPTYQE